MKFKYSLNRKRSWIQRNPICILYVSNPSNQTNGRSLIYIYTRKIWWKSRISTILSLKLDLCSVGRFYWWIWVTLHNILYVHYHALQIWFISMANSHTTWLLSRYNYKWAGDDVEKISWYFWTMHRANKNCIGTRT